MCTRAHNENAASQSAYPLPGLYSVSLVKGNRQGHANATCLFSSFQFSLEAQNPQLLSKEDNFPVGEKGGAAKVTLQCHVGVYCTGHKTHCDKLPTSHLLLMARQIFTITHIRMQVVWARRDDPTGRAASGGALALEPPHATRRQPEFIRTVHLVHKFFFPFFPGWASTGSRLGISKIPRSLFN